MQGSGLKHRWSGMELGGIKEFCEEAEQLASHRGRPIKVCGKNENGEKIEHDGERQIHNWKPHEEKAHIWLWLSK